MRLLVLACVLLSGCGWLCHEKVRTVEVVVERVKPCAVDVPPPAEETFHFAGPDEGCPAAWAACLDHDSHASIILEIGHGRTYTREVQAACRQPAPATQPTHP